MVLSPGFQGNTLHLHFSTPILAAEEGTDADAGFDDNGMIGGQETAQVSDPLEPVNRFFFHFNDKLYFWVLKPVARGYGAVMPQEARICIKNAFFNLLFPIRFVNNLLQFKMKNAGIELSRFVINSTIGVAGLGDPARNSFGLEIEDEDLGQTFGYWGIGNGIYFCWPVLGPSTLRDSVGLAGDSFLNPLGWVFQDDVPTGLAVYAGEKVNNVSLVIGDYEAFLASSFDPYISLRDAYIQHRQSMIKDSKEHNKIY